MTSCNTSGPDQPMWAGAFSSPSLVNPVITAGNLSDAPTISYPAASFLMKSLAAHHPKLEWLSLFPEYEIGNHADEAEDNLLAFLSGNIFYEYAAQFTNLKRLSSTFAWFNGPALRILGQLPYLEAIDVCGVDDADEMNSDLSEDSFPALRTLSMHGSNPFDAAETLRITKMVKNLTSLCMNLDVTALMENGINEERWLINEFFPFLVNTPHLIDLKIDVDSSGASNKSIKISESVLRIFQRLPLKSLYLGQIHLDNAALRFDLASVWPRVSRLHIPQQPAPLTIVSRFAVLPELQYLGLQLDLLHPLPESIKTMSPLTVL